MASRIFVLFLVMMMMVSSCCVAGARRAAIGGIFGLEQQHHRVEETMVEGKRNMVDSLDKSIDNHHSIPRQDWDNNSSPGNGANSDDGSG